MRKNSLLKTKLARLNELATATLCEKTLSEIHRALAGNDNIIAGKAAEIVRKRGLVEMASELVLSFERFIKNPTVDKQCLAKNSIIEALNQIEYDDASVFLQGCNHVQMEPVWGTRIDTAGNLRASCAFGLVRIGYPEVGLELAGLAMDMQVEARRAAVKAAACLGGREGELILRMKSLAGDEEPDVTIDCLSGLISVAPMRSLDFVADYMDSEDKAIAEGAAIALGESHMAEAFSLLQNRWNRSLFAEEKKMLLLPIALLRLESAYEFLMKVIEGEHSDIAAAAARVISICANDKERNDRVRQVIALLEDPVVSNAFAQAQSEWR